MVGGVFEWMIRCTKQSLRKIIGQANFSHDELLTAISEVEMVLNSRPLSYLSTDDLEEPLIPSHLIVGQRLMNTPDYTCQQSHEFDVTPNVLTRRARYLSATINSFWENWKREYLVGLREVHCQCKRNSYSPQLSARDIMIIHSNNQPRGMWKIGRVEKLLTGHGGESRAAVLWVAGQGRMLNTYDAKYKGSTPLRYHPLVTRQMLLLTAILIRPLTLSEMGCSHNKMKKVDLTVECSGSGGQ